MELWKRGLERGWLERLLVAAVAAHRPQALAAVAAATDLKTPRARARRYLARALRESGLLYGTPALEGAKATPAAAEDALFLAVLQGFARVALDVAVLCDAPPGPRAEQLLVLFAAMIGEVDQARELQRRIERASKAWPLPKAAWARVEDALGQRAMSLSGDPYYGLVLHNGALYSDAHLFGRLALACFSSAGFPAEAAERRLRFAGEQKALLVQVLVGLACAERKPSFPARRAILRQIEDLGLPAPLYERTRAFARKAFDRAPAMKTVLKGVRSASLKRFILEQTLLASLVDGSRSAREVEYLHALGALLGFSAQDIQRVEIEMASFYKANKATLDVFTLGAGAEVMGEELVESLQRTLEKNLQAFLVEARQTGDLAVLLARAARGQRLSAAEKARMREQLIDVAKAIPALAIFAAPGGVLLLLALSKVLPLNLLPSAFRREAEEPGPEPRSRSDGS